MSADLWAVHIEGPDDILAVPDYVTAVQVADRFNGYWRSDIEKCFFPTLPTAWAKPVRWSGSIPQHAEQVAHPDPKYTEIFVDPPAPPPGSNAPPLFDDAFLGKTVTDAIRMFSSPTIGRGTREGQRGFIVYEDEVEFITLAIRKAVGHTPAAMWRARGEPDPHGIRYEAERASLMGGDMTDDQVSDMLAMLRRDSLKFEGILAIAKDRIRWLSRMLVEATERRDPAAEVGTARPA
jgi:hypothetical protein